MNRTILFFAFMLIATGARGNDYAGIYILVSVDETAIPGMVSHEGHDMMLYSGETGADGIAEIAFPVDASSPGQAILIDLLALNGGVQGRAQLDFTPAW